MSGIAELLLNLGFEISGSDLHESDIIKRLESLGISIQIGHHPDNIGSAEVVVYSSAIPQENSEIVMAHQKGLPVIRRAEMLGELISMKETSIGVGGTHGKTSTSSMIGSILAHGKKDPTMVVGGLVKSLDSNSKLGDGNIIVVEADEFDRSFLALNPTIGVITNIELEHTDCYADLDDLQKTFLQFAHAVPFYGEVILCIDSPALFEISSEITRPITTYGFSDFADYQAINFSFDAFASSYSIKHNDEIIGDITLNVPGKHNILNSLAAIIIGLEMGLDFSTVKEGIKSYAGVRRRFELKGIESDIMVVDDYAHHPTEVSATLQAAKSGWNRRIISIFQPHLFSRTQEFFREFGQALLESDLVLVTDVYPAREKPISGITGEMIYKELDRLGHANAYYVPDLDDVIEKLDQIVQPGDLVITLGAGNIWRYSEKYIQHLSKAKTEV
ncbi:MAG: UDP-N-acetylmuramate--L-alanine ligase [Candidatus Marinimicrobia bacterium]|nr:UDP-N-acetylmuramate--L-alanine ligase [Candidatus Neomarinimicrobiota bacterium]MBT3495889.1 UDP-N-acetylmuramate--L-alanine ligase [Candidatus Neomarinimicrobiota bacterium]MBT3692414.1 UDP-N-acetylmuramate--L-alanine ligase [Candidatus Neomarinimicrobiota bacterium]MBT3732933.1 UDP-N-acetylmuramate--L-alanine ligase [Candidatus Neomarinimicrobiota bacterium]MBT4144415.1 UDP-N-acetylmuramate--L-alanine ligase [Candidatus Neomarinimicrobiota bacterium]